MNFKLINHKKIVCILLSGFIIVTISGCSKTDTSLNKTDEKNNEITIPNEKITTSNKEQSEFNISAKEEYNETDETYNNNEDIATYSQNDETAIATFNDIEKEVDTILNSENVSNAKDKVKGTFITIVDFIFYDSEINGVTFDELTDSGKQKVLEIANKIDNKIENKFPNYKDTISDTTKKAFNKASELIKKGANNLSEFSKEKLGEENYNAIINAKDEMIDYTKEAIEIIGEVGSNVFNSGKEYIKNWYENLKRD